MNEPALRNRTFRLHIATLVIGVTSLISSSFLAAKFYFELKEITNNNSSRISALEEFQSEGSRYTASDARRDFLLRDQRIDSVETRTNEKFTELQVTISTGFERVNQKLDLLFQPR
jgi:hypothetical protein